MSKKPKIDHEYHANKDKMEITIQGGIRRARSLARPSYRKTNGAA